MTGDEAIARGAWEAGVKVAAAYPGTPATEILENLARYDEIYAEWSPNEKVAVEVAGNAAIAGVRAIASMKHVGLNVAADPLMTLSYTGIGRGFVIVSADDPGMHSSQNEQDNRYYAQFAKIPMLEPANSQEALEMVRDAFTLSEEYDTPVLIRVTTRVCHGKSPVTPGERIEQETKAFSRNTAKYVMIPGHARKRHVVVEERTLRLRELSEKSPYNRIIKGTGETGIITSGVASQYAMEVAPEADFLLLGMTNPIPSELIRKFAATVRKVYIIEELEPYLEDQIRALGIECIGKKVFPRCGELSPEIIRRGLTGKTPETVAIPKDIPIPARPPVLCPGCPHRGFFHIINKNKLFVTGDIGCYTLSVLPPLTSMDTCICMGASITGAIGFSKAFRDQPGKKAVAVLGDSTFLHSGLTGLMDTVYNKANVVTCVLDNRTTAMTGHQEHPGTGRNFNGEAPKLSVRAALEGLGVTNIREVGAYKQAELTGMVREALDEPGFKVIIARHPCMLKFTRNARRKAGSSWKARYVRVDQSLCTKIHECVERFGCPSFQLREGGVVEINRDLCIGDGSCRQTCPSVALVEDLGGVQ